MQGHIDDLLRGDLLGCAAIQWDACCSGHNCQGKEAQGGECGDKKLGPL
jgi:hypothetical protein